MVDILGKVLNLPVLRDIFGRHVDHKGQLVEQKAAVAGGEISAPVEDAAPAVAPVPVVAPVPAGEVTPVTTVAVDGKAEDKKVE